LPLSGVTFFISVVKKRSNGCIKKIEKGKYGIGTGGRVPIKSGFKVGQARQTRLPSGGQAYGGQG